ALCVAYSGQCFSSEAWGGRSANRGQCAQACRLPYELLVDGEVEPLADARYLLSPGDLYTLRHTAEIVAAGVGALKIEGRYKDADYVALTTNAYRRAVDDAWAGRPLAVTSEEELRLEQVYSRGLGAHFVTGTNHQAVVNGRAPRHRGVLMGTIVDVTPESVMVRPEKAHRIAPLKPGDGVVFDAASWRSPGEREEGGRVFSVATGRDGLLSLEFGNRAVDFARIRTGDLLWRTDDPTLAAAARPFLEATAPVQRQPVSIKVTAQPGEALVAEWWLAAKPEISVSVRSETKLMEARNRGLSEEQLREQFGRLGGTPYALEALELEVGPAVFAPVSVLNQLRRDAVTALTELQERHDPGPVTRVHVPKAKTNPPPETGQPVLHLLVRTPEQLDAALEFCPASITLDYLDLYGLRPSVERVKAAEIPARVASPRILKPGEAKIVNFLVSLDCEILVRATGILYTLRQQTTRPLIGDFSLNAANALSAAEFLGMGIDRITPTHDLNAAQIADLARAAGAGKIEAIAYQHLPVFHTEHCVFCRFLSSGTSYKDCGRPCEKHRVELRDQNGRAHPVMADVGCRNTVFGAEAQEASTHLKAWLDAGIRHFRLEFAHESAAEVRSVTEAWQDALAGSITPAQLNAALKAVAPGGTTQGSLHIAGNYLELPILQ
ncbi:MAG: peptidase, partial [Bryobacterales bacterium]|nr:peptidase [Bryobacterales bacterium]